MSRMGDTESYLSALIFGEPQARILPPAAALESVGDCQAEAVERINKAEQHCLAELKTLRREAQVRGYEAGMSEALATMSTDMEKVKQFAACHKQQIGELVIGCLENICGQIPPEQLLPAMIERALQDRSDQLQVLVRVNPKVAAAMENLSHTIKIETDVQLGETDCVIETPECIKNVSLSSQLNLLRQQFNP